MNTNQMKNLFFSQIFSLTPTFSVTHIAAVLSLDFIWHSFFNIIFRHAVWNEPMCVRVCLMSLLCRKWATSSKGHTSGLWLVDFDPSHLLSISKSRWMMTDICYASNTESGYNMFPINNTYDRQMFCTSTCTW